MKHYETILEGLRLLKEECNSVVCRDCIFWENKDVMIHDSENCLFVSDPVFYNLEEIKKRIDEKEKMENEEIAKGKQMNNDDTIKEIAQKSITENIEDMLELQKAQQHSDAMKKCLQIINKHFRNTKDEVKIGYYKLDFISLDMLLTKIHLDIREYFK